MIEVKGEGYKGSRSKEMNINRVLKTDFVTLIARGELGTRYKWVS